MLNKLFAPSSIALVGATERSHIFRGILRSLQTNGYSGPIYGINPKYDAVFGHPCFPTLTATPTVPGLAIIAIPAPAVPTMLEECADIGIAAAHICATGFAEAGVEGQALFEQVRDIASRRGILLLGPGSFGYIARKEHCAPFWGGSLEPVLPGNVGLVAQSGGFANLFAFLSAQRGFGFTYLIASGGEASLTGADYLSYLVDDPDTRVLVAILEEIKNIALFADVAERALKAGKPLVMLKVGRSERGERAAQAHSGSLAGQQAFHAAFFKQKGVITVDSLDDLQEVVVLLSAWADRLPSGPATAVITVSGGDCVLMADLAEKVGLPLPELEHHRQQQILEMVPDSMMPFNPVDTGVTPNPQNRLLSRILLAVAEDPSVQVAAARLSGGVDRFNELAETRDRLGKPLLLFTRASEQLPADLREASRATGVPLLLDIERAFKSVREVGQYSEFRRGYAPTPPRQTSGQRTDAALSLLRRYRGSLPEEAGLDLLDLYGIPTVTRRHATTSEEAAAAAELIGFPVALKIHSADILHKTEVGGVAVDLRTTADVQHAFERVTASVRQNMPNATISGVLVQQMVHAPIETILGLKTDPQFGSGIVFGLGGVLVEVLRRTSLRIAPLADRDIQELIDECLPAQLFAGVRGQPPVDRDQLSLALRGFADLSLDLGEHVSAIDVNPLMLGQGPQGVCAVDCAVVLAS